MNYSALKKEVSRDGPGRLYMLWGPEDYLIADFTETLRQACLEGGAGEFDAKRLDGPKRTVRAERTRSRLQLGACN